MTPLELELLTLAKPIANKLITAYVIPDVQALESKIGNAAVLAVVEAITNAMENLAVAATT